MNGKFAAVHVTRLAHARGLAHRAGRTWLHPAEIAELQQLAAPRRRESWLAGRYCLKRQIIACRNLRVPPSELKIVSRTARNLGATPVAWLHGEPLSLPLSLSHSEQFVAVAIGHSSGRVGIDLIDLDRPDSEALSRSLKYWFSREELESYGEADDEALRVAWCAKEAAFKTLAGEPFQPQNIRLGRQSAEEWAWTYDQGPSKVSGRVVLQRHPRFVLAIAQRGEAVSPC